MTKELLAVRKEVKSRKPTYVRVQSNQFAKLRNDQKWRRPKGMGNKDRRNRRGHIGMLKVGYGSPKAVRGLNSKGLKEVLVSNIADLEKITSKEQVAVVSATVGGRKKAEIVKAAQAKKIAVANAKSTKAVEEKKVAPKTTKKAATKKATTKKAAAKKEEVKAE